MQRAVSGGCDLPGKIDLSSVDWWLVPGYGGGIMKKTIELKDQEWGQVVMG